MRDYRNAVIGFAIAFLLVAAAALLTTFQSIDKRLASDDAPPGAIGLARPHPPLYPGQPVRN
jgi:hypothetical protein